MRGSVARVERSLTLRALSKPRGAGAIEDRLFALRAQDEVARIEGALREASARKAQRQAEADLEGAIARERARCLAIARLWPDNLMAREIARRIELGGDAR